MSNEPAMNRYCRGLSRSASDALQDGLEPADVFQGLLGTIAVSVRQAGGDEKRSRRQYGRMPVSENLDLSAMTFLSLPDKTLGDCEFFEFPMYDLTQLFRAQLPFRLKAFIVPPHVARILSRRFHSFSYPYLNPNDEELAMVLIKRRIRIRCQQGG